MALDLKILIEGDPDDFIDAIDKVKKESADLNKTLSTIGTGASVAFAAFSGAIVASVVAFRESERVLAQTEATLQSTGFAAGFTAQEISAMALSLQDASTFGDEAIITGQNLLLTFTNIGQKTFPRASQAMLDMATALGTDLPNAAQLLGKALNDPKEGLSALSRVGIRFTDETKKQIEALQAAGKASEAQAIILSQLETRFAGSAKAAAGGLGSFIQFKEVLGDIVEGIGKQFAPAFAAAGTVLTNLAKKVRDNETLLNILARVLAAGAGMAGFIAAVTLGTLAISKIVAAVKILTIAFNVSRVAVAAFAGAATLGIGLIIAFLPEIIAFAKDMINAFTVAKDKITQAFVNLGNNLLNIGTKIGEFLKNLFTFNFSEIKSSAQAVKDAVTKAIDQTFKDVVDIKQTVSISAENEAKAAEDALKTKEEQDRAKIELAKKTAEEESKVQAEANQKKLDEDARIKALQAEQDAIRKEIAIDVANGTAEEVIRIKEQEIQLLSNLENAKTANEQELAQARLEQFRANEDAKLEEAAIKAEEDRIQTINDKIRKREEEKALEEEFALLDEEERLLAQEKSLENLNTQEIQKRDAILAHANEEAALKKKSNEAKLKDQIKYGEAYATINAAINSREVQGVASAAGQLAQLTQSKNSTLKGIGKAAAVTQIGIDTAKSAMSIYAGFATIPIIGPALGVAGAAAAIAFGAEKISQVRSAQEGGVVPGSGSGDIIPAFLEPGEIVVPRALSPTFAEQFGGLSEDPNSPARRSEIKIGSIIGTEEFVKGSLVPAIRDAVQLDNANIGVG